MVITDEKILDYLEHHGVKGMRWGSRKASSIVKTANSNAIKNVQRVQKERDASRARNPKAFKRKETAKKVAIAGAIVAPLVVRAILKQHGKTKFKAAQLEIHAPSNYEKYQQAQRMIIRHSETKYHAVKAVEAAGKISGEQSRRIRNLNTREWINALNRGTRAYRMNP